MAYLVVAAVALALIGWILFRRKTRVDALAPAAASEGEEERPFGEDIANPDSRVIPEALVGLWGSPGESAETALVIGPSSIREGAREEQVVAVRFIGAEAGLDTTDNVAVVSQVAGGRYSLHMMGLSSAGELVDLENMDMALARI